MNKPTKPSELNVRGTNGAGHRYFKYHAWYMSYNDPNSTDYPIVAFLCDSWNADPGDDSSGILVMSFKSKDEYENWTKGESPNPSNAKPIDPEDADELADSGITLITACNFD